MSRRTQVFLAGRAFALFGAVALVEGAEGADSEISSGEWDYMAPLALLAGAGAGSLVIGLDLSLHRMRGAR